MKIKKIETLHCDAGWRPWSFIKVSTDEGIAGYSECTDSHGSPWGICGVVKDLEQFLLNKDPRAVEKLYWEMYSATRQSPGSIIQKAIGGIENALLDIKAKALGIPVYELFGGPLREQIRAYWSHCGTTRVRSWKKVDRPALRSLEDVVRLGEEVKKKGFTALKTNILIFDSAPYVYMPGFGLGKDSYSLNISRKIINSLKGLMDAFRKGAGEDTDIILDLNFNFKTDGYIQIARAMEQFELFWLEIDTFDPQALLQIKESSRLSICSGENLYSTRDFRSYFEQHAMDIASIDIIWNGFSQSKKIADMAETYEINITPHNYYSHLATFISANFSAVVPNFKILEVDIDDVPWKDELVTNLPEIKEGYMNLPSSSGWGTELKEEVIRAHPWPG